MPQPTDFSEIYKLLQEAITPDSPQDYFLFLLGTTGRFTPKPTAPERIYERGDTLSYIAQIITALLKEKESPREKRPFTPLSFCNPSVELMNGPTTMGSEVGQLISMALFLVLRAMAQGKTRLHITGHSRGAVETILLLHELERIKKALTETPEKSLWQILIDSPCRLTRDAMVKLFTPTPEGDSSENRALLLKRLNTVEINAFLIDPVPGDKTYAPGIGWYDERFYHKPPCHHYELLICRDERSSFFYPIIPKAMRPTIIPGHHGTPVGNLYCQQYMNIPGTLKHLKTNHVQDLVVCKILNFIHLRTGLLDKYTEFLDLGHPDLDVITNAYLKADPPQRNKIMLDLYLEIAKNDEAYRYFSQTHYPYLLRDFALGNHRYIHFQNSDYTSMGSVLPDLQSGFVNAEHALLYLGNYVDFSKNQAEDVDVQISAITCTLENILLEMKGISKDKPLLTIISHDPGRDIFFNSLSTLVSTIGQKYLNQPLTLDERKRLAAVIKAPFYNLFSAKHDEELSPFKSIIEQFESVLQDGLKQTLETHYETLIKESKRIHQHICLFLDSTRRFQMIYRDFIERIPTEGDDNKILLPIKSRLSQVDPSNISNVIQAISVERQHIHDSSTITDVDKEKIQTCLFDKNYDDLRAYSEAYQLSSEQYLSKIEKIYHKLEDLRQTFASLKPLLNTPSLLIDQDNLRIQAHAMLRLAAELFMDKNRCLHDKQASISLEFYHVVKKQAIGIDYLLHDLAFSQHQHDMQKPSTAPALTTPFTCLCGKSLLFFNSYAKTDELEEARPRSPLKKLDVA